MKLSASSEPVLAVLSTVAALASSGAVAGVSNTAAVPPVVTGGLSVTSVAALLLGWFIRRYTSPASHTLLNAELISSDVHGAIAEAKLILSDDPGDAALRIADDALAAATALLTS